MSMPCAATRGSTPSPAATRSVWRASCGRQPVEHRRVQLVGSAVEIEKGAGIAGAQHRHAGHALQQLIDQRVLGTAQLLQAPAAPRPGTPADIRAPNAVTP